MPIKNGLSKGLRNATQGEIKRGVTVAGGIGSVTTVSDWYKNGHFATEEQALGAFKLAHQQALDGMGQSHQEWMGMTSGEFEAWMRNDELPKRKRPM